MSRRNANSGKDKLLDDEDEVLQAVILADSFNKRFRPLTTRKPRVRRSSPQCTLLVLTRRIVPSPHVQRPPLGLDFRESGPRRRAGGLRSVQVTR